MLLETDAISGSHDDEFSNRKPLSVGVLVRVCMRACGLGELTHKMSLRFAVNRRRSSAVFFAESAGAPAPAALKLSGNIACMRAGNCSTCMESGSVCTWCTTKVSEC